MDTEKRFLIVFGLPDAPTVIAQADTLAECRKRRKVSGDIVLDAKTREIVQSEEWLWDWEREEREDSFAWRLANGAKWTW